MACNSCGNKSGFNGSCNSCSKVPDIDTESALDTIKNGDENFCFNEVTDEICSNLKGDKGIHPYKGKNHNDCEDLHALNTYLHGNSWNSLKTLDFCDINALRCWLYELVSNSWNMTKGLVCAICGLWDAIHKIIDWINNFGGCEASIQTETTLWAGSETFSTGTKHTFSGIDIGKYNSVALEWVLQKPGAGEDYMRSEVRRVDNFPNPQDTGWFIEANETQSASDELDDPSMQFLLVGAQALTKDTIYAASIKVVYWLSDGTRVSKPTTARLVSIKGYKTINLCPPKI